MLRILVLLALMLSLSSCFSSYFYYSRAEEMYFFGLIDGEKKLDVDRYDLVYLINGDSVPNLNYAIYENVQTGQRGLVSNSDTDYYGFSIDDWHLKTFGGGFCNAVLASSKDNCGYTLRGVADVKIYLRDNQNGSSYLLAQKTVDMDAYRRAFLITQVYVGSNFERYETRSSFNIDWNKMKPLVLDDGKDTIYHYTAKYWEKHETNSDYVNNFVNNFPAEKYFVEVP